MGERSVEMGPQVETGHGDAGMHVGVWAETAEWNLGLWVQTGALLTGMWDYGWKLEIGMLGN